MRGAYHHRTASRDGHWTHIEEVNRALRANGHAVVVCTPDVGAANPSGGSGGWVGRIKRHLPRWIYELAEVAYSLVAFRKHICVVEQSVAQGIYERYNLYLIAGVWVTKWRGVPFIPDVNASMALERRQYDGLSWPGLVDCVESHVWKSAGFVSPVTRVFADHMNSVGVDPRHIVIAPSGINLEDYARSPFPSAAKRQLGLGSRIVVGVTGFVWEWDRLDQIVRWIVSRPGRHNLNLLVIGDGPARGEIEARVAVLGVSDRLTFTGAMDRSEMPALAAAFDITLQTALVPLVSPLCRFEHLALGIAIVVPDQANHHEVLVNRVDALLYDPLAYSGIDRALDEFCDGVVLLQSIAVNASLVVPRDRLARHQHSLRIASLFSTLLPDKGQGGVPGAAWESRRHGESMGG